MTPDEIIRQAQALVTSRTGRPVKFTGSEPIGGGSINEACCLDSGEGKFFLKWNHAAAYPGMFEAEAKGLMLLQDARAFKTPTVIGTGTAGRHSFILMEWMEPGRQMPAFWKDFGKKLAALHRRTQAPFGLDHDNYIGSLPQRNTLHASWPEFYFQQRLEPQLKRAIDSGKLAPVQISRLANLHRRLAEMIPKEIPSLLHGDLWNGNFLVDSEGFAALIDPAIYYGHREMDLAMSRLFGGFDREFYTSYEAEFPLEAGFESRMDIHQLYPLLVHVNLFGGGYAEQVERILRKF